VRFGVQDSMEVLKSPSYSSPDVYTVNLRRLLEGNDVWMLAHVLLVLGFRSVLTTRTEWIHGKAMELITYPGEHLSDSQLLQPSAACYRSYVTHNVDLALGLKEGLERPENDAIRSVALYMNNLSFLVQRRIRLLICETINSTMAGLKNIYLWRGLK
jgi:hypothetical protein